MDNQITKGVIWKQLLFFFFPILLGTFFQQLYNTVDSVVVGRFVGKNALASVGGSAAQITSLVLGFFTGLSAGAAVIISQFYGAEDQRGVSDSVHTAYAISLAGSALMMFLGMFFTPALLQMMNTPAELFQESALYLRIYFGGILFVFIYNMGASILRAVGDSKRPFYYLIVCCIINIILDLIFVLVFQMGVAGVAIATLIAQAVSAILITRALMVTDLIPQLSLKHICFHKNTLKAQMRLGLPGGIQSTTFNLSNVLIQAALNAFGTNTVAAWAAYGKLDAIYWMINGAFGVAITTFVGQNFGAGKNDRVKKSVKVCLAMDLGAAALIIILLLLLRVLLFRVFTSDPDVIKIGSEMLALITPCYIFYVFIEVLAGALRGIGDILVPTLLTMFGVCVLRILWLLFVVPLNSSVSMIIFSYPVTWILTALSFIIYYVYKQKRLS